MTDYTLKDHGVWVPYTPDPLPEWATLLSGGGARLAFLKRESDGADWYEYRNTEGRFSPDSVLACTLYYPTAQKEVVKSVFRDSSMIFPASQRLLEIDGVDPTHPKPHKLFEEMIYDPATQTLSGEPGPKIIKLTVKKDIWLRATDTEADEIETWLSGQKPRQQRLFNDSVTIDHSEQLYQDLLKAFTDLFGVDRANELLALPK